MDIKKRIDFTHYQRVEDARARMYGAVQMAIAYITNPEAKEFDLAVIVEALYIIDDGVTEVNAATSCTRRDYVQVCRALADLRQAYAERGFAMPDHLLLPKGRGTNEALH